MKQVVQFFHEVSLELSRVVWPKWSELVGSTIIVMILVTFFSIYLGAVDFLLTKVAGWVFFYYGMH